MVALKIKSPSRGTQYSIALHCALLALVVLGLPQLLHTTTDVKPHGIDVDLVSGEVGATSAPPSDTKVKNKGRHDSAVHRTVTATRQSAPPAVTHPTRAPAKRVTPPAPATVAATHENFDSVLHSLDNTFTKNLADNQVHTAPVPYIAARPMATAGLNMSEMDALIAQINHNWNAPVGARDAANLIVPLHIELNPDGSLASVNFTGDKGRYASDSAYRAAVDSALRAVHLACPLKNLPAEKYSGDQGWHAIDAGFDPKNAN